MRQYNVIFGTLLILSTIHFALAAPIPGQENHQTYHDGDVVPRDVITVSEKRAGDEELKQAVEYMRKMRLGNQQASSSSAPEHGSMSDVQGSSSAPPGPVHESTIDEAPNSAPSTHNPNTLVEPTSPSSTETLSSGHGSDTEFWTYYNGLEDTRNQEDHVHQPGAVLSQQVNDVAHGTQMDDLQPPTLPANSIANGHHVDDVQPPTLQSNGMANGHHVEQLPVVGSLILPPTEGSVYTATSSDYGSDADLESILLTIWNSLDHSGLPESYGYVHQPSAASSQQEDDVIHGIQMDGAQPPPQVTGVGNGHPVGDVHQVAELPSPWTSILAPSEYASLPQPVYDEAHEPLMDGIHQQLQETGVANWHQADDVQRQAGLPSPASSTSALSNTRLLQQVDDVTRETQMGGVQQQPQETGAANGHGLDGAQQPSTHVDQND